MFVAEKAVSGTVHQPSLEPTLTSTGPLLSERNVYIFRERKRERDTCNSKQ